MISGHPPGGGGDVSLHCQGKERLELLALTWASSSSVRLVFSSLGKFKKRKKKITRYDLESSKIWFNSNNPSIMSRLGFQRFRAFLTTVIGNLRVGWDRLPGGNDAIIK